MFWRGRFIDVGDISWAAIYFTLGTHQIDCNSYMCFQGGTTEYLSNSTLLA